MIRRLLLLILAVAAVLVSAGRWWALSLILPGLVWTWHGRRRGRLIPGQGPREFPIELRRSLFERDGGACRYCGRFVHYEFACQSNGCDDDFEADHVVAYSRGGPTTLDNGVTSCRRCNRAKSDRTVEDFLADPGFEWEAA